MKIKYDIYEFELIDIQSLEYGLMEYADLNNIKPMKLKIVGYLVKEDVDNFFVAKEAWETGQFKYVHIIPRIYVLSNRRLK